MTDNDDDEDKSNITESQLQQPNQIKKLMKSDNTSNPVFN